MYIKHIIHQNMYWQNFEPYFRLLKIWCTLTWFGDIQDSSILYKCHKLKYICEIDKIQIWFHHFRHQGKVPATKIGYLCTSLDPSGRLNWKWANNNNYRYYDLLLPPLLSFNKYLLKITPPPPLFLKLVFDIPPFPPFSTSWKFSLFGIFSNQHSYPIPYLFPFTKFVFDILTPTPPFQPLVIFRRSPLSPYLIYFRM